MDVQFTSELCFGHFTYAEKDNEITFLMQLVSYRNPSGINGNHQNNILTVATGNDDVIRPMATVVGCYAIAGLVPPHSSKMGIDQFKNRSALNCAEYRH
jgi:hypothetical protein